MLLKSFILFIKKLNDNMFKIFKKFLVLLFHITPNSKIRNILLKRAGYEIGEDVYIPKCLEISDMGSRKNTVSFGGRVSIGPNVTIITDSSPNNSRLISIYPLVSKNVILKNDVWIGAGVIILPGVTIHECSVIGAGSVVTKDIEAFSIALGSPAKIVSKIDKQKIV